MGYFDWKDEYSIGIAGIDAQHRKIVELIEDLFESIRDAREEYVIGDILADLATYAKDHFALEEKVLERFGNAAGAEHERQHEEFIAKVRELREGDRVCLQGIPIQTLDVLKEWFKNHEMYVDAKYARSFAERGLVPVVEEFIRAECGAGS